MSRSRMRLRTALAPPVLLAVLLVMAGAAPAAPAASQPMALAPPYRYCYRWNFLNNTGQDADDLHVRLLGPVGVGDAFSIPFGAPAAGSGYESSTNTTVLNFSGSTAINGQAAEVGLCTAVSSLRLAAVGRLSPFRWTLGGTALTPDPLFLGLSWTWKAEHGLQLLITNDSQQSLIVWSVTVVDPGAPLLLDDLTSEAIDTLPAVAVLPEEPVTLAPGAQYVADLTLLPLVAGAAKVDATGNEPLAVAIVASAEDDLGNLVELNSEALTPQLFFLPLLLKQ